MLLVYSLLPYKTPWCALGFLHGFTLLGGLGAAHLWSRLPRLPLVRVLAGAGLATALAHLAWQAYRASFVFPADRRNPYVYAHAVYDVVRLGRTVEKLAAAHPDGTDLLIRVLGTDYWPLPWYLRRLDRVGYWREIPDPLDAPVLIAPVGWGAAVRHLLRMSYETQYFGLRPDVTLELYVSPGLWRRAMAGNSGRR
jgi:predicted membrane-bound mannosyltransferase